MEGIRRQFRDCFRRVRQKIFDMEHGKADRELSLCIRLGVGSSPGETICGLSFSWGKRKCSDPTVSFNSKIPLWTIGQNLIGQNFNGKNEQKLIGHWTKIPHWTIYVGVYIHLFFLFEFL